MHIYKVRAVGRGVMFTISLRPHIKFLFHNNVIFYTKLNVMETTFRVRMNLLGNNVSRGVMFETASFSFYPLTE